MEEEETSVIIIGGGIVGLSAALFLQQHNLSFILLERHSGTSIHPRARGVNVRTIEMYRELGIEKHVMEVGERRKQEGGILSARTLQEGLDGFEGGMAKTMMKEFLAPLEAVSPCKGARITQDLLEPILLEYLKERGGDARFYTELISFTQSEGGVSCEIQNRETKQIKKINAKYMIAADGANSFVRRKIGASVSGKGILGKMVNVLFKCDMEEKVQDKQFSLCRIDREEVVGLFTSINLKDIWVFHILDTSMPRPQDATSPTWQHTREITKSHYTHVECEKMIKIALGMDDKKVEILSVLPWDSAMNVMDHFIHGNIFFAGDAAHQMPPWGGQGANSGIADVHNLAWKLAYVIKGFAPPQLLATYQVERHPIDYLCAQESADAADATGLIDTQAFGGGGKGGKKGPWATWIFSYVISAVFRYPWFFSYFIPKIGKFMARLPRLGGFGFIYTNLVTEEEPPSTQQIRLDGRQGTRCPHVWLIREDGTEYSTLDKFGKKFILLAGSQGQEWINAAKELKMDKILEWYVVGAEGDLKPKEGFNFEATAGIQSDGVILVRPDGIVGWRRKNTESGNCTEELRENMVRLLER